MQTRMHAIAKALGAAFLLGAASAQADTIYIDVGTDYDASGANQVCSTCTGYKEQLTFVYDSHSVVYDDGDGVLGAGDTIITGGGWNGLPVTDPNTNLSNNVVTQLTPVQIGSFGESGNGYGPSNDWFMTFSFTGLTGTIIGVDPSGLPLPVYGGPTTIDLYVTFDSGMTFNNFMDLTVQAGFPTGLNLELVGEVDFTNVDSPRAIDFHLAGANCNGSDAFFDIWSQCSPDMTVRFLADQNLDPAKTTIVAYDADGDPEGDPNYDGTPAYWDIVSNHDGSIVFVPEPSTLALAGLALLGMGGMARRRRSRGED